MSNNAGGTLTELAALGNQDAYLVINPEVTFFKQLYRRHTNFAKSEADIGFQSAIGFDRRLTAVIPRNGDLIAEMYWTPTLEAIAIDPNGANAYDPATAVIHWTNGIGQAMLGNIEIQVGGQVVDRLNGEFLQIWEQASGQPGKRLQEMIGHFDNVDDLRDFAARNHTLHVPLYFWFCKHSELNLPLIALQYHEVKVQLTVLPRSQLVVAFAPAVDPNDPDIAIAESSDDVTGGALLDAVLTVNYVYLDTMERRIHAQMPHEYLITQLQMMCSTAVVAGTTQVTIPTHFNHPTLQLFWLYQENRNRLFPRNQLFNFAIEDPQGNYPWQGANVPTPLVDPVSTFRFQLNGSDRTGVRNAVYYRTVTYWEKHTNIPDRFIYQYAFCLDPEGDQKPSGSLNLSRIDNAVVCLQFTLDPATGNSALTNDGEVRLYARNFNVVKIAGGMLAVRHAN